MTKAQATKKLTDRISTMTTPFIVQVLKDMAKPWDKRTSEESMVRAYLFQEFENREGEDAVDALFDIIEALEESKR